MPNISTLRTRYDHFRHRAYGSTGILVTLLREVLVASGATTTDGMNETQLSAFRAFVRTIRFEPRYPQRLVELAEADNPAIARDLIRASQALSLLCGFSESREDEHVRTMTKRPQVLKALWETMCRWCCEDQGLILHLLARPEDVLPLSERLHRKLDAFLAENVHVDETSPCPTTVKGTEYRMACLVHKLLAYTTAIYYSRLKRLERPAFIDYVSSGTATIPLATILVLIGAVYAQQLGMTTIRPYHDGKDLERLYGHLHKRLGGSDGPKRIGTVLRHFVAYSVNDTDGCMGLENMGIE